MAMREPVKEMSARGTISRRDLARLLSSGVAALGVSAWVPPRVRGFQGSAPQGAPTRGAASGPPVLFRLSSNENNYGLAPAAVASLTATKVLAQACRYGGEASQQLTQALARANGVPPESIMLAAGSGEILRAVTLAFTGPGKPLVQASPTFEAPGRTAEAIKAEVRAVPVTSQGLHDLKAMAAVSVNAGLAFVCNPNNPTGGINPDAEVVAFLSSFRAASKDGYVLVDEAYYEYATHPAYASAIPMALKDPKVLVSRTFSKIHGMAGMRVGFLVGHPDALALVRAKTSSGTLSSMSAAAALASFEDQAYLARQKTLNAEARAFTRKAFVAAGCTVLPSEGNFIMVDVKREAAVFQQMCREVGVAIARPFPPLTNFARITIGTAEDMQKAVPLMLPLLSAPPRTLSPAAAPRGGDDWLPADGGC
jgi:histidinol-phosphate aminotransferase